MSRSKKTPNERYVELITQLGLNHAVISDTFGVDITTSRRWANNPNSTPCEAVVATLMLMQKYGIDTAEIKRMLK